MGTAPRKRRCSQQPGTARPGGTRQAASREDAVSTATTQTFRLAAFGKRDGIQVRAAAQSCEATATSTPAAPGLGLMLRRREPQCEARHFGDGHRGRASGAPVRSPPAPRGHADQPPGKQTGWESPRDQSQGHATGRGVLADPPGSAPLRGAAPVGSAESSSPWQRGDCVKVAGRGLMDSPHPPARWWDELRLGTSSDGRGTPAHRSGGGRARLRETGDAEHHDTPGKGADPRKAKPKGASGSGSRQRGLTATDFTADQSLEADRPPPEDPSRADR